VNMLRNRSGKLPIVIIIAAAVVVVGGLGVVKVIKGRKAGKQVKPPVELSILRLSEFTVNLADRGEPHYLKVTMVLEVEGKQEAKEGDASSSPEMVKASDAIISVLTKKRYTELLTEKGKEQLKADLIVGLNQAMESKPKVHGIYFTAFAMQ
jgi:flagellar basal body-associated protein FliL